MRALILVECLVVLALAGLILVRSGHAGAPPDSEVFPASQFLANANRFAAARVTSFRAPGAVSSGK